MRWPQASGRTVLIAFGVAVVVFILTHIAPIPGSLRDLIAVNGGHPILDQVPAASTKALYDRLEAFGADGRALYQRFLLTTDIVFPLGVLAFLFLLAKFSAERFGDLSALKTFVPLVPALWFAFDMMENLSIVALLAQYPAQNDFIASYLSTVTLMKQYALGTSIVTPAVLLLFVHAKQLFSR